MLKKVTNSEFKKYLRDFDWGLFLIVLITSIVGIVAISSATSTYDNASRYIMVQSAALIIGIIMAFVVIAIDYSRFAAIYKFVYVLNVIALIIVLFIGVGKQEWGGQSWIRIGPVGIQPAEIVKIGFIITFAKHLELVKEKLNTVKQLFLLLVHAGVLIGLILLQPDLGTAMVFVFIVLGMLYIAGLHYKYIIAALLTVLAALPPIWFFLLKEYQKKRILVFFNPDLEPLGAGYHAIQSRLAVGSGQLYGEGLFKGIQTQLGYLPEKHTDFIFAVISEELGFIGSVTVLVLLIIIIGLCIRNAQAAKDDFGSFICTGVASMLMFHTFENIGMCIGLTPVTGVTLPFLSYGGSSLLTNWVAIALVLNVGTRRKSRLF